MHRLSKKYSSRKNNVWKFYFDILRTTKYQFTQFKIVLGPLTISQTLQDFCTHLNGAADT